METATCIVNMVLTKKVSTTPYELCHRKLPLMSYLNVWVGEAYVKCNTSNKLQLISQKYIFMGYPKETIGDYFFQKEEN